MNRLFAYLLYGIVGGLSAGRFGQTKIYSPLGFLQQQQRLSVYRLVDFVPEHHQLIVSSLLSST
jgi:hypothetical protein